MYLKISNVPSSVFIDVFFNVEGGVTLDMSKPHSEEILFSVEDTIEDLTAEFIKCSTTEATGRIESRDIGPAYKLLATLKRSVRMLEDAVFDVTEADNKSHEDMQ